MKVKIGSALKDCDKIQKSVHRDPNPGIPFADTQCPLPTTGETIVAVAVAVVFILLIWVV